MPSALHKPNSSSPTLMQRRTCAVHWLRHLSSLAQRTAVLPSVRDQPGPKLDLWTSTIEARESFNLNTRRPGYYPLSGWTYLGGIEDLMDDLREGVLLPSRSRHDSTRGCRRRTLNRTCLQRQYQSRAWASSARRLGEGFSSTPPSSVKPPSAYLQSGKRSVRFSLARIRRPTLFQNVMNDVDRVSRRFDRRTK